MDLMEDLTHYPLMTLASNSLSLCVVDMVLQGNFMSLNNMEQEGSKIKGYREEAGKPKDLSVELELTPLEPMNTAPPRIDSDCFSVTLERFYTTQTGSAILTNISKENVSISESETSRYIYCT